MSEQMCGDQRRVTGVLVTCHRTRQHKGPHSSSTYGTRWDGGEVLPPPAAPNFRQQLCTAEDCNLWLDHAGPHGRQETLL